MKDNPSLALLASISLLFSGCVHTRHVETPPEPPPPPPPSIPVQVSGTELNPYDMSKVRTPEAMHAYYIGPYIDPQDSGIRHDGHRITRIESSAKWNLSPSAPTAVPLGPVIAVADPAKQTAQLSAELENKIAQANLLVAALIEQNEELLEKLEERDKAIEELSRRISEIESK